MNGKPDPKRRYRTTLPRGTAAMYCTATGTHEQADPGVTYPGSHHLVQEHPWAFVDADSTEGQRIEDAPHGGRASVERATARPGTRR